eukprot:310448_1
MPSCFLCGKNKARSNYSKTQLKKGNKRKCRECTHLPQNAQKAKKKLTFFEESNIMIENNNLWMKCAEVPLCPLEMVKLNNYLFLAHSYSFINKLHLVSIYNALTDEWKSFKWTERQILSIAVDYDKKVIYILTVTKNYDKLNSDAKVMRVTYDDKNDSVSKLKSLNFKLGGLVRLGDVSTIFIKGQYHLIQNSGVGRVGDDHGIHYIYNTQAKKLDKISEFEAFDKRSKLQLTYFERCNILICLESKSCDLIKTFSFDTKQWSKSQRIPIKRLSLDTKQWTKSCDLIKTYSYDMHDCLQYKEKEDIMMYFGNALSDDKECWIMYGYHNGDIHIMEIKIENLVNESVTSCEVIQHMIDYPIPMTLVVMGREIPLNPRMRRRFVFVAQTAMSDLLICGYYRMSCIDINVWDILPLEMVNIIAKYSNEKSMHLISYGWPMNKAFHCKINMRDVDD